LSEHGLTVGCRSEKHVRGRRRKASKLLAIGAVALMITGITIIGTTSAFAANSNIPITITPNTGLTNGSAVTITGSGFAATSIGNVLECNSDSSQPTVMVGGLVNSTISVSCIAPSLQALVKTDASGGLSTVFHVIQGTVGPPCGPQPAAATCPATDSAGKDPTADAALYPCPPTAAQQAIGDVCTLSYGDESMDSGTANILFAGESPPSTTPTTAAPTTATTKAPTPSTTVPPATGASGGTTPPTTAAPIAAPAPAGALASTGPGPAVGWLSAIGGVLLLLGLLLLLVQLDVPQKAFAGFSDRNAIRKQRGHVVAEGTGPVSRNGTSSASGVVGGVKDGGHRLGQRAAGVPDTARGLSRRAVSASTRTAAWLLGR
jgi:hypothetical protein